MHTHIHTHAHTHVTDTHTHTQDEGNNEFLKNLAVLELAQTIRSDHSLFEKYQHSSKLVKLLNSFARTECDLPDNWEKRVDRKTGKVSHNGRSYDCSGRSCDCRGVM